MYKALIRPLLFCFDPERVHYFSLWSLELLLKIPLVRSITQKTFTHQFLLDSWEPYYIEGLDKGRVSLKLELLNKNMDLIESDFNPSFRKIDLE